MSLSSEQSAVVREQIAKSAQVEVSRVTPAANVFRDLGMDGMSVTVLLFALNEKLTIDLLPIFNEFQQAFELDGQGRLTETSRQRLGQLLPGVEFAVEGLTSLDDLWSVAIMETLIGQQLQRLSTGLAFEPISSEKQQGWVRELPRELGERKLRLLLAAACRHALQKEPTLAPAVVDAMDLLERFADTGKTKKALRDFRRTMSDDWFQGGGYLPRTPEYRGWHPYRALYDALAPSNCEEAVTSVAHAIECVYELSESDAVKEVRRFHGDLVSPLPAGEEFAAAWRTPSVVQLAESMPSLLRSAMDRPLGHQHGQQRGLLHWRRGCGGLLDRQHAWCAADGGGVRETTTSARARLTQHRSGADSRELRSLPGKVASAVGA